MKWIFYFTSKHAEEVHFNNISIKEERHKEILSNGRSTFSLYQGINPIIV
jgi:hypothetical protein